jgi:DNA-directed RNA polymerase sigma subunit (sigma70/sigma32)
MDWPEDTPLDAIAAQARAYPPLPLDEVEALLQRTHQSGGNAAAATLVRHHLFLALDAALQRKEKGLDLSDLYQEGSIAVVTAVEEYARRGGPADGLRAYVERVVALHLDAAIEREVQERAASEAFVRDAQAYELVEVDLHHRLGREPTSIEMAAALEWSVDHVEAVAEMLNEARALNDEALLPYLDDTDEGDGSVTGDEE